MTPDKIFFMKLTVYIVKDMALYSSRRKFHVLLIRHCDVLYMYVLTS